MVGDVVGNHSGGAGECESCCRGHPRKAQAKAKGKKRGPTQPNRSRIPKAATQSNSRKEAPPTTDPSAQPPNHPTTSCDPTALMTHKCDTFLQAQWVNTGYIVDVKIIKGLKP